MGGLILQVLKILNSKEIKQILRLIENHWGAKIKLDCGFLKNQKNRIFLISKDISRIDVSRLKINSIGMYFCEIDNQGIRLSIEGSQIIGPKAHKNIVEINEEEIKEWFIGEGIEKECKDCSGFVILKRENDFFGNGKYANGKILNYVGKSRRVKVHYNAKL